MRKNKDKSQKTIFWENHLNIWKDSSDSQKLYCQKNGLSESVFSKWKSKLNLGKRRNTKYKEKSKYAKFSKLPDKQLEKLMYYFVIGLSVQDTSVSSGVSEKTIYRLNKKFRLAMIDGAFNYSALFFGVGILLILGSPFNQKIMQSHVRRRFNNIPKRGSGKNAIDGELNNKIQTLHMLLIYYSEYKWKDEELSFFKQFGYRFFYKHQYSKKHGLPSDMDLDMYTRLLNEFGVASIVKYNWEYWASNKESVAYFDEDHWNTILLNREMNNYDKFWKTQMFRDLKWCIKNHKIARKSKVRNLYWDDFLPSNSLEAETINWFKEQYLRVLENKK